jgi:hypothetical protein
MGIAAFFRRPVRQLPAWLYGPCLIFVVIVELLLSEFRTSRWASWTGLAWRNFLHALAYVSGN